jgi:hypothetical protein
VPDLDYTVTQECENTRKSGGFSVAGVQGFEPQLPDPESGVLPLDDTPMRLRV